MAGIANLTIQQGATERYEIEIADEDGVAIDLTGHDAAMQIRNVQPSETIILSLNSVNGYLTVSDPTAGILTIDLPSTATSQLPILNAVYDLEIFTSEETLNVLRGKVQIIGNVTR